MDRKGYMPLNNLIGHDNVSKLWNMNDAKNYSFQKISEWIEKEFIKVFLGSMPNKENKILKVSLFEQSHLRGFLSGNSLFQFGFILVFLGVKKPAYFNILSKVMTREEYYVYLKSKNYNL